MAGKAAVNVGDWVKNDFTGRIELKVTIAEKVEQPKTARAKA